MTTPAPRRNAPALGDAHTVVESVREEEALLAARRDEVRRRADYLRHVAQEIESARLVVGEDLTLDADARRLGHAETLAEQARRLGQLLDGDEGGALSALGQADRILGGLERIDPALTGWRELLDGAYANLTELARLTGEYADGLQDDPGRLAEIERRRDLIYRLKQKYGETLESVMETRASAARELDLLDTADLDLRQLGARRVAAEGACQAAAEALSLKRREAAGRLGRAVTRLLPRLGLAGGGWRWTSPRSGESTRWGRRGSPSWFGSTPAWNRAPWPGRLRGASSRESCWRSRLHWPNMTRSRPSFSMRSIRESVARWALKSGRR